MKKLFGGIDLTWKKLIIFAVIAGVYTAIMALLPWTYETSFRDIAIMFEWWILFGIIIIANCKSPMESALKCFVFFLISQPLVYLIQVPFTDMGWRLFQYYRYWFMWTLACFPMGYVGYYINKKNYISILILMPMFVFLMFHGVGYLNQALEHFPNHLLSGIACFLMIIVITWNLFEGLKYKLITYALCLLALIGMFILGIHEAHSKFETVRTLDSYGIHLQGEAYVTYFAGTKQGDVELIPYEGNYNVKLYGSMNGKYEFTLTDETDTNYQFEYYFDKEQNTVLLIYHKEER